MRVHNVCITGSIVHTYPYNKNFVWRQKTVQFYDNSIVLKKKNFQLCLTKNIRSVLTTPNLKHLFKRRLELEFRHRLEGIDFKIGNIHNSIQIAYNSQRLVEEFLPKLNKRFDIEECLVTQEQNAPVLTAVSTLFIGGNLTFLAINLKLQNKTVTIKLQVDRTRIFTHATLILTEFTERTRKLIEFFEQHKTQDND